MKSYNHISPADCRSMLTHFAGIAFSALVSRSDINEADYAVLSFDYAEWMLDEYEKRMDNHYQPPVLSSTHGLLNAEPTQEEG